MDLLDEFRTLIARHVGGGGYRKRQVLDGVSIAYVDEPTPPIGAISEPSLWVVGQGVKRTVLNGAAYDLRAGQYLVASIDLPVTGQAVEASVQAPLVSFSLRLEQAAIAPLLLETAVGMAEKTAAARTPAFSGLAVSDTTPELLDPIVRLLRLVDSPDDLRVLAAGFRREILWRLVTGDQGAFVRQIGLADSSITHIARAIRWIRAHYDEPLRIADLAALARMSASTFHRHFRAATTMTPIQFQKQIRLQEARNLLMTRTLTVAEVGYRVGYQSPSQFITEYRNAFGTPPGRDAVRLSGPS